MEKMEKTETTKTDLEKVKDLYTIICNGEIPDRHIDRRVNIVAELERLTNRNFRNTVEFHYLIADYIKRQEGKKLSLGEQTRKKRRSLGWTQTDLAHHLGVTKRTVINYEANNTAPSQKLVEWLNINGSIWVKGEIGGTIALKPEKQGFFTGER